MRKASVTEHVIFHDAAGVAHEALVTAVWSEAYINVVFVSADGARTDHFGRQIEGASSAQHVSVAGAPANYWRFPEEAALACAAPQET